jgi:hypothetical protein
MALFVVHVGVKIGWREDGEGVWSRNPEEICFSAVGSTGRLEKIA